MVGRNREIDGIAQQRGCRHPHYVPLMRWWCGLELPPDRIVAVVVAVVARRDGDGCGWEEVAAAAEDELSYTAHLICKHLASFFLSPFSRNPKLFLSFL